MRKAREASCQPHLYFLHLQGVFQGQMGPKKNLDSTEKVGVSPDCAMMVWDERETVSHNTYRRKHPMVYIQTRINLPMKLK